MPLIYVVEDDTAIRNQLIEALEPQGHAVASCPVFHRAVEDILRANPDLVLLDLTLPGTDGQFVCRELRQQSEVPIIVLTSRTTEIDEVMSMTMGADDFIPKPYSARVLMARIQALLRRARIVDEHRITIGDVELDYDTHTVRRGHDAQVLPPKEFNLLYKLLAYPERTFTRLELLDEIWGMDSESDDKTVNVHINRLRTRFYDWPEFEIQTIRGIGYRAIKKV